MRSGEKNSGEVKWAGGYNSSPEKRSRNEDSSSTLLRRTHPPLFTSEGRPSFPSRNNKVQLCCGTFFCRRSGKKGEGIFRQMRRHDLPWQILFWEIKPVKINLLLLRRRDEGHRSLSLLSPRAGDLAGVGRQIPAPVAVKGGETPSVGRTGTTGVTFSASVL